MHKPGIIQCFWQPDYKVCCTKSWFSPLTLQQHWQPHGQPAPCSQLYQGHGSLVHSTSLISALTQPATNAPACLQHLSVPELPTQPAQPRAQAPFKQLHAPTECLVVPTVGLEGWAAYMWTPSCVKGRWSYLHVKDAAARAKGKVAWNAFPAAWNMFQEHPVPPFSSAPQMRQRKHHHAAQSSLLSSKHWVLPQSTVKRWLTGRWNPFKILKDLIVQLEVAAIV